MNDNELDKIIGKIDPPSNWIKETFHDVGLYFPVLQNILSTADSIETDSKFKEVALALMYLKKLFDGLEARFKNNFISLIKDTPKLLDEMEKIESASFIRNKNLFWANYLIALTKEYPEISFDEISFFNKLLKDFIEIDFAILKDLYDNGKNINCPQYKDKVATMFGQGEMNYQGFFVNQNLRNIPSHILQLRLKFLMNNGMVYEGMWESIPKSDNFDIVLITELGLRFYTKVIQFIPIISLESNK